MTHAYAVCLDCHELTHGVLDGSKGFRANEGTNTHWDHNVRPFGDVTALPSPIRTTIARLGAGLPIDNNHIVMLRLGLDLEGWTCPPPRSAAPTAANTSTPSPAPAGPSVASTKSPHASRPSRPTPAPARDLLDLLAEATP